MTDLSKVAIIGAGSMGSGIAQKSAQEGFSVQMVDRAEDHVERGFSIIRDQLDQAIQRRIFSEAQVDTILGRIEGVVGTESVDATTDLVIEAVFEDLGIKSEVFQTLDAVCGPETILASNTSSLSVADLASASGRPDRFVGLHFFYHPAKNRLIEVIPGPETSEETLARTVQYCRQTGKVVIVCSDRPGFVVNRFFVPWLNEATRLAEEGIATPAQIDAVACRAFRIGLGPFGLMNLTGPPIALHSTDILSQQLSVDRYHGTKLLRDLVEEERMWDLDGSTEVDEQVAEQIRARLLGVVFGVAAQLVEEQVCSMEDVDRGAKVGLRWGLGPFEMMNELGVARSHDLALAYQRQSGIDASTWALPAWLESQATEDRPFRFRWVDLSIEDGRATVTINRPEAMNALNEEVVEQLHEALDEIDAMDGIRGLVLDGAGKAFVAGADVKFFVDRIRASAIPDIEAFTARGKALFDRIEALEYPTVALHHRTGVGWWPRARTDLRPPHRDAQDHIPLSRDLHRHLPSARRHPTPSQDLRTSGREVGRPRRQSDGPRDRACDGAPDRPGGTLRGGGDARRHPRFRCLTGSLSWVARRPRSSLSPLRYVLLLRCEHVDDPRRYDSRGLR